MGVSSYTFLREFFKKGQSTFSDTFFSMNYPDDPCEIILKGIIINEACGAVIPKIKGIVTNGNRFFFSCESNVELHSKKKFDTLDCYKCGEFVGMMHSHKFEYFGNLYNFKLDNAYFGERFCQKYKAFINKGMLSSTLVESNQFNELEHDIRKFDMSESTFVMLNPAFEDIVFDETRNVCGYSSANKMVLAIPELEILSWKKLLGEGFAYFIDGYRNYCKDNIRYDKIISFICNVMNRMDNKDE